MRFRNALRSISGCSRRPHVAFEIGARSSSSHTGACENWWSLFWVAAKELNLVFHNVVSSKYIIGFPSSAT